MAEARAPNCQSLRRQHRPVRRDPPYVHGSGFARAQCTSCPRTRCGAHGAQTGKPAESIAAVASHTSEKPNTSGRNGGNTLTISILDETMRPSLNAMCRPEEMSAWVTSVALRDSWLPIDFRYAPSATEVMRRRRLLRRAADI